MIGLKCYLCKVSMNYFSYLLQMFLGCVARMITQPIMSIKKFWRKSLNSAIISIGY